MVQSRLTPSRTSTQPSSLAAEAAIPYQGTWTTSSAAGGAGGAGIIVLEADGGAAAGALGPKLLAYWAHMTTVDAEAMRVKEEILGALSAWDARGRWHTIAVPEATVVRAGACAIAPIAAFSQTVTPG